MTERTLDLVDRLRGKYVLPVNDGAGLLNGKDTLTRQFETPPIHHEAAAEIERLRKVLKRVGGMAGLPDATQACRNICAVVRETLSQ